MAALGLIFAGGGVRYSEAADVLRKFAEQTGIPVAETHAGKGAMPYDHPLSLGGAGVSGTLAANVISHAVAERMDGLVLPNTPFGVTPMHAPFEGTITLTPDTYMRVVKETCVSTANHGAKELLIVNWHEGNIPSLAIAAESLHRDHGMSVLTVQACYVAEELYGHSCNGLTHGGEIDDAGDAGEVLQQDARRAERDLVLRHRLRVPLREGANVVGGDVRAVLAAQQVLEEHPERERQPVKVDTQLLGGLVQPEDVVGRPARVQRCARPKAVQRSRLFGHVPPASLLAALVIALVETTWFNWPGTLGRVVYSVAIGAITLRRW